MKHLSIAIIGFLLFALLMSCGRSGMLKITDGSNQKLKYNVACVGYYNLENLFDTIDTDHVRDTEFSPSGSKHYGSDIYYDKLAKLSSVIAIMGTKLTPDGPAILGVSEIENRSVLEDLVMQPAIADRKYKIVHHDSPDKRGIDVALLYQEKYFIPESQKAFPVLIYNGNGERIYTRDVLLVTGQLNGERIHVLVNHWPSRRGGEEASRPRRNKAADVNRMILDSLNKAENGAKVLIIGDFNDNPNNQSFTKHLLAKPDKNSLKSGDLYNPAYQIYIKGIGSTAYRDVWSLFDQLLLSEAWLNKANKGFQYYKYQIVKAPFMMNSSGRYKGYPHRCFVGDKYLGGYSDHLPVVVFLVKKVSH